VSRIHDAWSCSVSFLVAGLAAGLLTGCGSESDPVPPTGTIQSPIGSRALSASGIVVVGETAVLPLTITFPGNNVQVSATWSVTSETPGAHADIAGYDYACSFTPSVPGTYVVHVTISDGAASSTTERSITVLSSQLVTIADATFDKRNSAAPIFAASNAPQRMFQDRFIQDGYDSHATDVFLYSAVTGPAELPCVRVQRFRHSGDSAGTSPALGGPNRYRIANATYLMALDSNGFVRLVTFSERTILKEMPDFVTLSDTLNVPDFSAHLPKIVAEGPWPSYPVTIDTIDGVPYRITDQPAPGVQVGDFPYIGTATVTQGLGVTAIPGYEEMLPMFIAPAGG
jgi:hypothetical protein